MKLFENKDFHYADSFRVQKIPFRDSHILFVKDVYQRPDRVVEYLASLGVVKSHKSAEQSRNGLDFLDGQHVVQVGVDPNRNGLEAKIAEFFGAPYAPRNHLVFNHFRLLTSAPRGAHWWPHTDSKVNILTFLNPAHKGAGTAFYQARRPIPPDHQEHQLPWRTEEEYELLFSLFDSFNCLVAFPGHWHHGMSIVDDTFLHQSRFSEICFL